MRVPIAMTPVTHEDPRTSPWRSGYRTEWGQVAGRRVRSLRQQREMYIWQLAQRLHRADGRPYSPSFVSRLERGFASPSLHSYVVIAKIFEVEPGALLGLHGVESPVSEAELALVKVTRELGIAPEAAIARLVRPG